MTRLAHQVEFSPCFGLAIALIFIPYTSYSQNIQSPGQDVANVQPASVESSASFRVDRTPIPNGSELLTLFVSLRHPSEAGVEPQEIPIISVLRDTLGDDRPENDRLRYVWVLTYTQPILKQRIAAAIPFFYSKIGNKSRTSGKPPPPLIDLGFSDKQVWNKFFLMGVRRLFLYSNGIAFKAPARTYGQDLSDYRKAQTVKAVSALSLLTSQSGGPAPFTHQELTDLQGRLLLSGKLFGEAVDESRLKQVVEKQVVTTRELRGQNWELLRQRAEMEGLYFDPLEMPDGSATHALVWIDRNELGRNIQRPYNDRFLNLKNPWTDSVLKNWTGYSQTRFFDSENREVDEGTPGAHTVELIPLALYGLDEPKIPMMLIDFRNGLNAKRREMSRRVFDDVARNILSLSLYGDISFFLARSGLNVVTGRRGIDYNQPSRVRAYSQLKLLLAIDSSLDPELRELIGARLERVTSNPLENDYVTEVQLARDQYSALLKYANRPDGLARKIDRDRREELVNQRHSRTKILLFRAANIASLGLYTHREKFSDQTISDLDLSRSMKFHERFLFEVAKSSPRVEVAWDIDSVTRSLKFLSENSRAASNRVIRTVSQIFRQTENDEIRSLCLDSLLKINNSLARNELLGIYNDANTGAIWRTIAANHLHLAAREDQRIPPSEAKAIIGVIGQ